VGVFSSRRLERRLAEDVGFRVLAAANQPNFRTIADFRKQHLATLAGLFETVLKIALEAGALKLGRVALDGTKMKANASKHKALSYGRKKEKESFEPRSANCWRKPQRWTPKKTRITGPIGAATSYPPSYSDARRG
jgi:hypothetical protein